MKLFEKIKHWITGMHLERIFQKKTGGQIDVSEASGKAADFLEKVQEFINSPTADLLDDLLGEEAQAQIEHVKTELPGIIAKLREVHNLPDISEQLDDYRFADDDHRNRLYHSIIKCAATVFSDGALSLLDAVAVIDLISNWNE